MMDIADAPWIRDAELNGMPESKDVYCPICNEENPEWFYVQSREIVGCSCCIDRYDPWEWAADHEDIYDDPYGEDD